MSKKVAYWTHRTVLVILAVTALLSAPTADCRSIALTFDDGPDMADVIGLTASERNAAILQQLAEVQLRSILFITSMDSDPLRNALIAQWGKARHQIGNHTMTHANLNDANLTLANWTHSDGFRADNQAIVGPVLTKAIAGWPACTWQSCDGWSKLGCSGS